MSGKPRDLRPHAPDVILANATALARDGASLDRACRLLRPLLAADAERDGTLARTLRTYYATGGSVAKTAEVMFLHRNSVRYRLDRVRGLLGMDIDHPENVAVLLTAFATLDAARRERGEDAAFGA